MYSLDAFHIGQNQTGGVAWYPCLYEGNDRQPAALLIAGAVGAGEDKSNLMSCIRLYRIRKSILQDMCQIVTFLRIIQ